MLLHSGHITAWYSRHDSDILLSFTDVLGPSRIAEKTILIHCAQRICTRFESFHTLVITVWKRQMEWFNGSSQYRTLDIIDGEPMEFEWNIFPGF